MLISVHVLLAVTFDYCDNSSIRTLSRTGAPKHGLQERNVPQMTNLKRLKPLKPPRVTAPHQQQQHQQHQQQQQQQQQALTQAASRTKEQRLIKLPVVKPLEVKWLMEVLMLSTQQQQQQQQAVARKLSELYTARNSALSDNVINRELVLCHMQFEHYEVFMHRLLCCYGLAFVVYKLNTAL
jgi:hypothetical protein